MGKKLTPIEVDAAIKANPMVMFDICTMCGGSEEGMTMTSLDPTGMSWDVVCDECLADTGTYITASVVERNFSTGIGGLVVEYDSMLGTVHFVLIENEIEVYRVSATPNWMRKGEVPVSLTIDGDCTVLGKFTLYGGLYNQLEMYEEFLKVFIISAKGLVD